jgi:hypothetical protein
VTPKLDVVTREIYNQKNTSQQEPTMKNLPSKSFLIALLLASSFMSLAPANASSADGGAKANGQPPVTTSRVTTAPNKESKYDCPEDDPLCNPDNLEPE